MNMDDLIPQELWLEVAEMLDMVNNRPGNHVALQLYAPWSRIRLVAEEPLFAEMLDSEAFTDTLIFMFSSLKHAALPMEMVLLTMLEKAYRAGQRSMLPKFIVKED